ncbi:MAG TPA: HXXEE domain-containing protein, partial [Leptolinea sp.]
MLIGLFIIHDGEEILFLPNWFFKNHASFDALAKRLPLIKQALRLLQANNQKQFAGSVLLLLLLLCIITGMAVLYPTVGWVQNIYTGAVVIFTLHLIIHIMQCFIFRKVVPGAATSVLVFVPSLYLWLHQLNVLKMSFGFSLWIALIGIIIFLPFFPLVLLFGHWAGRSPQILE